MTRTIKASVVVIPLVTLLSWSCNMDIFNGLDNRFKIKNNSSQSVYYFSYRTYPDTTIGHLNPKRSPTEYKIAPGERGVLRINCCWESVFKNSIPSDTLMLFIFDSDIVENSTWQQIQSQNLVLKRYDLSLKDLESRNWVITYP